MKRFAREFREFAVRGNMLDLAVGVIVGGAFTGIVNSMVRDILMPVINIILGGSVDFTNKFFVLRMPPDYAGPMTYTDLNAAGGILFAWGSFVTVLINFLLLALVVFVLVRAVNRARRQLEHEKEVSPATPAAAPPPEDIMLLREIRDALQRPLPPNA